MRSIVVSAKNQAQLTSLSRGWRAFVELRKNGAGRRPNRNTKGVHTRIVKLCACEPLRNWWEKD